MSYLPKPKLPVIDLSIQNLNCTSSSWLTKCDEVTHALEEYGCFRAMYDGVSKELHDAIFLASKQLFALPTEVKVLNTLDTPFHGYGGQIPAIPLYEGLGIKNATTREGVEGFTKTMWPSGNDTFSESVLMYTKAVAELDQIVMRMVAKSYGIEEHCELLLGSTTYLLKPIKYRSPQENQRNVGKFLMEHDEGP